MKNIFLLLILTVSVCFALDDVSVTNTFSDSAIIEADDFNDNFDDLVDWSNALIDTLDQRFMRFSDLLDSTLQKITLDSLRGNPDVDSLTGRPYTDSVKTSHIEANQADINGGSIDGAIIGAASEEDATFDSVYCRVLESPLIDFDTLEEFVSDSILFLGSESKFFHFDSTFPCSLFFDSTGGTKFRDSCMATATIIGKNCILTIPKDFHDEVTGVSVSVGFHFSIPSKFLSTTAYQVPVRSDTNTVATWGRFNTSDGSLGLFPATGTTIFPPTAGGPYPFTIMYRLD